MTTLLQPNKARGAHQGAKYVKEISSEIIQMRIFVLVLCVLKCRK